MWHTMWASVHTTESWGWNFCWQFFAFCLRKVVYHHEHEFSEQKLHEPATSLTMKLVVLIDVIIQESVGSEFDAPTHSQPAQKVRKTRFSLPAKLPTLCFNKTMENFIILQCPFFLFFLLSLQHEKANRWCGRLEKANFFDTTKMCLKQKKKKRSRNSRCWSARSKSHKKDNNKNFDSCFSNFIPSRSLLREINGFDFPSHSPTCLFNGSINQTSLRHNENRISEDINIYMLDGCCSLRYFGWLWALLNLSSGRKTNRNSFYRLWRFGWFIFAPCPMKEKFLCRSLQMKKRNFAVAMWGFVHVCAGGNWRISICIDWISSSSWKLIAINFSLDCFWRFEENSNIFLCFEVFYSLFPRRAWKFIHRNWQFMVIEKSEWALWHLQDCSRSKNFSSSSSLRSFAMLRTNEIWFF